MIKLEPSDILNFFYKDPARLQRITRTLSWKQIRKQSSKDSTDEQAADAPVDAPENKRKRKSNFPLPKRKYRRYDAILSIGEFSDDEEKPSDPHDSESQAKLQRLKVHIHGINLFSRLLIKLPRP